MAVEASITSAGLSLIEGTYGAVTKELTKRFGGEQEMFGGLS